jgi:hypothetical protein
MQKYVLGWIAIFVAFVASFPVAIIRVSQSEKFWGQPLNSLTCEGQMPAERSVTEFTNCTQLNATSSVTD